MELKRKQIKGMYKNIIKVGYCELPDLLSYTKKMGYTAGIYGWNADIFQVDWNTAIITGYRPFGNIDPDRMIIRKYNEETRRLKKQNINYEQIKSKLDELIENFKNEVIKEGKYV